MPIPLHDAPLAQAARACHDIDCLKTDDLVKLRSCGKCGTSYYCSKQCQRKDWPRHKAGCIMTAMSKQLMLTEGETYKGYKPRDVEKMLKKWTQVNRPLLSNSAMNALATRPNHTLWKTHALCIFLEPNFTNPNTIVPAEIARGFKIEHVQVMSYADAVGGQEFLNSSSSSSDSSSSNSPTVTAQHQENTHKDPDAILTFNRTTSQSIIRMFQEERQVYAYSTLILLYVTPMHMIRMVPDGYGKDYDIVKAKKIREWEEVLRRCVRDGVVV